MFEIIPTFVDVFTNAGYIPKNAEADSEVVDEKN
jgi:hypothetical protein